MEEEKEKKLDHTFCSKFRADIERYGLKQVICDLISSTSEKVAMRKKYLARECSKKNAFKKQFVAACEDLKKTNRKIRLAVIAIQQEIVA